MIEKILKIVESNSERWFGRFIAVPNIDYFYTSDNSNPYGKLTMFLFEKKENSPIAVIKIVRNHKYSFSLKKEYDNLVLLDSIREKIKGIPEAYYYGEFNKTSFLIESYLPGRPLYNRFNELFLRQKYLEKAEEMLDRVFSWIRDFHHLTAKAMPAYEFFKGYQPGDIDKNSTITIGTIQGDYWARNILFDGSNINVVDWEWSESEVPLVWDVFFFVFTLLKQLTFYHPFKGQPMELIFLLRNNNHWLAQLLRQRIDNYIIDFNLDIKVADYLQNSFLGYLAERGSKMYGVRSAECVYWRKVLSNF